MDQIDPFLGFPGVLVVALAKFKEDHQTSQKYLPKLNGFILQWAIHQAVIQLQSLNTKMTPHLLPELLMALRANDAEGLKGWLTVGFE
jgi:hypothetical protein